MEEALFAACAGSQWDRHRSAAELAFLSRAGAAVLAANGVTGVPVRARGWSNVVWLVGDVALRLATTPDALMGGEIELITVLPPAVGHSALRAVGTQGGFAWMLTARVDAVSLADARPDLTAEARARAIVQTWERTSAIHRADLAVPLSSPLLDVSDQ